MVNSFSSTLSHRSLQFLLEDDKAWESCCKTIITFRSCGDSNIIPTREREKSNNGH